MIGVDFKFGMDGFLDRGNVKVIMEHRVGYREGTERDEDEERADKKWCLWKSSGADVAGGSCSSHATCPLHHPLDSTLYLSTGLSLAVTEDDGGDFQKIDAFPRKDSATPRPSPISRKTKIKTDKEGGRDVRQKSKGKASPNIFSTPKIDLETGKAASPRLLLVARIDYKMSRTCIYHIFVHWRTSVL
ncbi:hypothetical protein AAG570_001697 [Ranatra chinensis]|uniref:Uncharacterized protein n=1 Tax=Ranatra chinensis TaxID=642074 RepID=A0ABD0YL90_9HEMI